MKFTGVMSLCSFFLVFSSVDSTRINPELDPKSSKKFFKKDYPDDERPQVTVSQGYPHPDMQPDAVYDKDYVSDKNDDNGAAWRHEEEYQKALKELKKAQDKLAKEKADLKRALEKEAGVAKDLEKVEDAESKSEQAAKAAEAEEADADAHAKDADYAAKKVHGDIESIADKVEREVVDLEDCKKQLAEARSKLKALLAEKEDAAKKEKETSAAAKALADKAEAADKASDKLEDELKKEEAEHANALKSFEEEQKDVVKTEADMAKAANELRKFRKADANGGVYRNGAVGLHVAPQVLLAGGLALLFSF